MKLVHLPQPKTPYGEPTRVELWEGLHAPWRSLLLGGVDAPVGGSVRLELEGPLFQGEVRGRTGPLERVCWGLPEWRRPVRPQSFQDAFAQDVIGYLAGEVGGRFVENLPRHPRRHYALPGVPAYKGVEMVLAAWGYEAVMHELDGGLLYIGPREASPHAAVLHRLDEEVAEVRPLGRAVYLKAAPLPALRLLHRVRYPRREGAWADGRLLGAPEGEGQVVEHRLVLTPGEAYHEVVVA